MILQQFTNNAIALLATAIGPSDTTIVVQTGLGSLYPQIVNPGEFFLVTLETVNTPIRREIIRVTAIMGDVLTCTRGQEGTSPQSWVANQTLVDHRITAETIRQAFLQPVAPVSGSGGIVYAPITIIPTTTEATVQKPYSDNQRLFKFWVQMYDPVSGDAQAFEIFGCIQGVLNGTEYSNWTFTNQVGQPLAGQIIIAQDTINRLITMSWQNTESTKTVIVTITSL